MKKALVIASVAIVALVFVDAAFACTQQCTRVPGTFCRICEDTGEFTGAGCQQSGPCGCFWVQVICADGTASDPLGLEEPLMTPVEETDSLVDQSWMTGEESQAPVEDEAVAPAATAEIG
jgi:hypothetical protein